VDCGTRFPHQRVDDPSHAAVAAQLQLERRQITAMFCDLVDSTGLASRLDPEDLAEVIGAYQSIVAKTAQRFGGFVARYMGDGVLVYFGWPKTDEYDAERSVRAGLAVIDAVQRIRPGGQQLHARVGIASGLVVAGEIVGVGPVQEDVMGQAVNLAARLQAIAHPDMVVIAQATRILVGDFFNCKDLGSFEVRGFPEAVRAWHVLGENAVQSRFEALRGSRLTPIIGREEEIELLLRRWQQVKAGEGRVVLIAGDPGIGKSRLVAAFEGRLRGEVHTSLRCFCGPHDQDSTLHPIIRHIENIAGFDREDTPKEKARKLAAAIAPCDPTGEDVGLFAELLSVPVGLRPLNLSPRRRKEKTFEALGRQLDRIVRDRPALMIFEDVHWADPTTLELLDITIPRIQNRPVLLIVTFRPEFQSRWAGHARASLLRLSRLDRPQSTALVTHVMGGNVIASSVIDRIVAGSDGVPLFIEELTKAVLENPSLREHQEAAALTPLAVPNTLQASLMARLNRYPDAKSIAQIGAVIGREFSHAMLVAAADLPEGILQQGLDQLIASELVFRSGTPPKAVYMFKHALVQDTAYESILRKQRAALHARVVRAMIEENPDVEVTQPGLLGHHCAQAGLIEQAASYYRRAGERSAERAAMAETHNQLERGLTLIRTLPNSAERRILEVELKLALGRVLLSTKGSADVDAGRIFEEVVELCRGLDRIGLLTRAIWGYWFNKAHRRELMGAESAIRELLRVGPAAEPNCEPAVAGAMLGITRFWQGRFPEARANLAGALDLWRTDKSERMDLAIVSNHLDVHVRMQHGLALTCLGYICQGHAEAKLATQRALELAHLPTRAIVIAARCRRDYFVRDDESLREMAVALVALAEEQGFPFYLALGRIHLGWLAIKDGNIDHGLKLLQDGLEGIQATDAVIWQPISRGIAAEAQSWLGNVSAALGLLDDALAQSNETGGGWFGAELHRQMGAVLLAGPAPDPEAAERCFLQALTISRNQSAKLWELKAATALARLWSQQGRICEAHALLAPVHAWFIEGRESADVKDAARLLAKLAVPALQPA
jgi:class 3 adenylate cyclase/predicted ATPase